MTTRKDYNMHTNKTHLDEKAFKIEECESKRREGFHKHIYRMLPINAPSRALVLQILDLLKSIEKFCNDEQTRFYNTNCEKLIDIIDPSFIFSRHWVQHEDLRNALERQGESPLDVLRLLSDLRTEIINYQNMLSNLFLKFNNSQNIEEKQQLVDELPELIFEPFFYDFACRYRIGVQHVHALTEQVYYAMDMFPNTRVPEEWKRELEDLFWNLKADEPCCSRHYTNLPDHPYDTKSLDMKSETTDRENLCHMMNCNSNSRQLMRGIVRFLASS